MPWRRCASARRSRAVQMPCEATTSVATSRCVQPRGFQTVGKNFSTSRSPVAGSATQASQQAGRPNPEKVRLEIRRIATDLFDFDEVSRRALSRHWAARTSQEQAEFISLFTDLLERSYVGKIESYSGEKIAYTGELVDGDYATVRSRIVSKRRTETALDYRLHRAGGRWKVYDVMIDGVSFVPTYRSEFNRIIQSSSWDDLMNRLRKKRIEIRTVVDPRAS